MNAALAALHQEIAACTRCGEAGFFAESSAIVVNQPEVARPKIMLVGQAPASAVRSKAQPFSGQAGRVLFQWLAQAGFTEAEFRAQCYFSAITKCYPGPAGGGPGKGDRMPSSAEQILCRPFLLRELALIQPKVILTVGRLAMTYFLGNVDFTATIGSAYPMTDFTVLPLPHPSGVSRWNNAPENKARVIHSLAALRVLRISLELDSSGPLL